MKKSAQALLFLICISTVVMRCQDSEIEYDDFIQTFFEVTKPDTTLVKELMGKTRGHAYSFLHGLFYREKYRLKKDPDDFANAQIIFDKLIKDAPNDYYGYAGKGLMYTERGTDYIKPSQDTSRQRNFNLALRYLKLAVKKKRDLAMLYFYMGKNEFLRYSTDLHGNEINLKAIYYLDTALQKKPGFYKAYLRSAQYLSHYTIVARSNGIEKPEAEYGKLENDSIIFTSAELGRRIPEVHGRIKYLFAECLKLKNKRTAEVFISMANASLTYFEFSRIGFLDSAMKSRDKDSADIDAIHKKKSEIYYNDLKLYKTALDNYDKWLQPKDEARHWVAKAWCMFHDDSTRRQAYLVLRQRVKEDTLHADQYYYAMGMMDAQSRKYQASLSELYLAREVCTRQEKPFGHILIEVAKIHLALNDYRSAVKILREAIYYKNSDDPFEGEVSWSAQEIGRYYKLQL